MADLETRASEAAAEMLVCLTERGVVTYHDYDAIERRHGIIALHEAIRRIVQDGLACQDDLSQLVPPTGCAREPNERSALDLTTALREAAEGE